MASAGNVNEQQLQSSVWNHYCKSYYYHCELRMCHVRIDSLTDVAITSGAGTNSHLNEFFFKGVWLVFPSCQNRRSSARRVTVRPPDHIRSRPPADSAVWRTAAGPPPPPSCCLSACLLAWCIQAGPQTHTGESLRLGTTLQHTGGGGEGKGQETGRSVT